MIEDDELAVVSVNETPQDNTFILCLGGTSDLTIVIGTAGKKILNRGKVSFFRVN